MAAARPRRRLLCGPALLAALLARALLLLLLPAAADPIDDMVRATLDDVLSSLGEGVADAAPSDGDANGVDDSDAVEGEADAGLSGERGLSASVAAMRRTLDDVLAVGEDIFAFEHAGQAAAADELGDELAVDDERTRHDELEASRPRGTQPTGRHWSENPSEDDTSLEAQQDAAAARRKLVLDAPPQGGTLAPEDSQLWHRAGSSFDAGEYREALPAWQELAASSGAFESSYGSSGTQELRMRMQISAAFNLALTYEQLGS
jgi:hypothetical protein